MKSIVPGAMLRVSPRRKLMHYEDDFDGSGEKRTLSFSLYDRPGAGTGNGTFTVKVHDELLTVLHAGNGGHYDVCLMVNGTGRIGFTDREWITIAMERIA